MLAELENYYNALQDKKSEGRHRTPWFLIISGILFIAGYQIGGINSQYAQYVYAIGVLWALVVVGAIVSPLNQREIVFEKVYKAMGLLQHQENPSTRRKLRRLLTAVLSLPTEKGDDPLLTEAKEKRERMVELIRRRLLPATRAGKVKETTLEMLAKLLRTPSLDSIEKFSAHLTNGYDDIEEITFRKKVTQLRASPIGLLVEPLAKATVLAFIIALGAAYLWATSLGYPDLVTYLNANPSFATGIFSFAGILIVGLFSYFRKK